MSPFQDGAYKFSIKNRAKRKREQVAWRQFNQLIKAVENSLKSSPLGNYVLHDCCDPAVLAANENKSRGGKEGKENEARNLNDCRAASLGGDSSKGRFPARSSCIDHGREEKTFSRSHR